MTKFHSKLFFVRKKEYDKRNYRTNSVYDIHLSLVSALNWRIYSLKLKENVASVKTYAKQSAIGIAAVPILV